MLHDLERQFLACVHSTSGGKKSMQVDAATVGQELGLRGEQTLHVIDHLATEGLLVRGEPGPSGADLVCITPEGIDVVLAAREADVE
ncbi:MAG: hypothetical protein M3434_02840 [Gemmatimonadota bacterium]|nr:hypothetical protein [Gemmatimonadota bacterium]